MYLAKACPCCGGESSKIYRGVAAPFIVHHVLGGKDVKVNLRSCNACGFRWFDQRFEPAEMAKLYVGYRGEAYANARHKYEPWYSRTVNDAIGGESEIRERAEIMMGFLRGVVDAGGVETVLDYGGDKGQFIPAGLGRKRYVYEVSGVDAVDGVNFVGDEKALVPAGYDMVMLCHVLEHLPDPHERLAAIEPLLKPGAGLLYVEVPYERFGLRFVGEGDIYGAYLGALKAVPFAMMAADFYSTGFRVKFGSVPPLGFVKMHEHINFFSEESLSAVLDRSGYQVLKCEVLNRPGPTGIDHVLHALARVKAS